jgi:hypothetical protein
MVVYSEERSFLDEYTHPMIQLNPMKVMLVMSHSENTYDKNNLRKNTSPYVTKTSLTLDDFISDATLKKKFLA